MSDNNGLILRPYVPGDEEKICALFEQTFGRPLDIRRWFWLYRDNRLGLMPITVAEEAASGRLVAQYAVKPVGMRIGGRDCVGTFSLDTMVHPEFQNRGLFVNLADRTYRDLADMRIPITYGFPNKNSSHGFFTRLDWCPIGRTVPLYGKVLSMKGMLKRWITRNRHRAAVPAAKAYKGSYTTPAGVAIQPIAHFDTRFDTLWGTVSDRFPVAVRRDSEYLNWRYVENPSEEYQRLAIEKDNRLSGYMVLKAQEKFGLRIGFIIDILTETEECADILIRCALDYFARIHVDLACCLMLYRPYVRVLAANRFIKIPRSLFPQDLNLGVRVHTDEYPASLLTNRNNWFVSWGDCDVI